MSARLPTRSYDWRNSTPVFFASLTSRSRARCISLASVGNATAFGCTVVSTITLQKSAGLAAPVRVATERLAWISATRRSSHPLAPARQRRAVERQLVLEELLAAEQLVIGILDPAGAQILVGEIVQVLED